MSRSIQKTKLPLPRKRISSEVFNKVLSPGSFSPGFAAVPGGVDADSSAFTRGGRYSSRNCRAFLRPERRSTLTCLQKSLQVHPQSNGAARRNGLRPVPVISRSSSVAAWRLAQRREQNRAVLIGIGVRISELDQGGRLRRLDSTTHSATARWLRRQQRNPR